MTAQRLFFIGLLSVAAVPAMAQDLAFTLVNQSSVAIVEAYATPTGTDTATGSASVLGLDALESGYTVNVMIADGSTHCSYDMRLVFSDGGVLEDTVDVCAMGSYTIN